MKLLVDARIGWGHGIGRVVANIVPQVAALHPDWQIDVLVGPADVERAKAAFGEGANLSVVSCAVEPFSLAEQLRLEPYAKGYDLTWFTNYWVPLAWRGRFVVTVHDMLHLLPAYFPASAAKRMLSRRTFHKLRRDAEAVMFVSRFTQREFTRMIGAPRRGEVVQLGGNHLDYAGHITMAARERRLLVVAASKAHKNFPMILDAWRKAMVADHWRLTIVCPGAVLRSSIDIASMAADVPRTEVLSDLSDQTLTALYADTSILLMPSLYEGFGLPLLEGLLAGAVCISSDAGAMVEVAEGSLVYFANGHDRVGWTGCIEAACAEIDGNADAVSVVTARNIAQARRLDWKISAKKVAALFNSISVHPAPSSTHVTIAK